MGNSKNAPDEGVVYLALKDVFKGKNSEIRHTKAIRKVIDNGRGRGDISGLLKSHNIDTICDTTRVLLTEQIFESTLKAKSRFPEVFRKSPTQNAVREASEAEATRNEENAIKDALRGPQPDTIRGVTETEKPSTSRHPKPSTSKRTHNVPSLYPVYFPLRTQHRLLAKVQAILEQACFDFGTRAMPNVLQEKEWDCPEAAELNLWALEFINRQDEFSDKRVGIGKPLETLFNSVARIRHTAVHRVRVGARRVEQFLLDGEALATILREESCLESLARIRQTTQLATKELEQNKHVLSSKLEETLKRIATQRAELDRQEEAAIMETVEEDREYRALAGTHLELAFETRDTSATTATTTANETGSDTEGESVGDGKTVSAPRHVPEPLQKDKK